MWPDEPYFVNIAENWNTSGILKLDIYRTESAGDLHIRAYSYPPLYYYVLGMWMRVGGGSIEWIRLLSVVVSIGVLIFVYGLIYSLTSSAVTSMLGTLCLVLFGPFQSASRVARWDIFVLLCLIATIYIWCSSLIKRKYLLAGIVSTVAFLFHPLGGLCILTSCLFMMTSPYRGKIGHQLISFVLPVGIGILFWFVLYSDYFHLFVQQMEIQFAYKAAREPLISLVFEKILSWRFIVLGDLILGSYALISGVIQKKSLFLIFGIGSFLGIVTAIITVDQWYFIFIPIFPLLVAILLTRNSKLFYLPLLLLLILHGINYLPNQLLELKRNDSYHSFVAGLSQQIPSQAVVVSSTVPDPYFDLRNRQDITIYEVPHVSEPGTLSHLLDAANVIIFNYATNKELETYLKTHTQKKVTVVQEDGYQADVIYLQH